MLFQLAKHRLVKDSLILFGVQITGYILPMVTLPYLTHVLGPENFGLLALGTALVLYFVILVEFGFGVTGPRQVAIAQADPEQISRIYSTIMACKMTLLAASALVLGVVVAAVPGFRKYQVLYWVSFLQVIGWGLSPTWLLQGMQKMRYVAFADYGAKIIAVALVFVLVRRKEDYVTAAALQSGGFLIAACIGLALVFFQLKIRLVRPTGADMQAAMVAGWPVFLSMASLIVVTSTNTMILGSVASKASVGYLSAASRLIIAARALTNPITTAVYPHMSKLVASSRQDALRFLRKQLVWTATPFLCISVGMLVLSPWLVKFLYGPAFQETGVLLRIMSLTPFVHAVSMCFGTYYMLAFGYEKAWSRIIQLMMVVNFAVLALMLQFLQPARAVALTGILMDIFTASACIRFYFRTESGMKGTS